jgi:prophage maintenance system killer protein
MGGDNPFEGLDAATLATLKTETIAAIRAVLVNSSYSLNGKSVTRADLGRLNSMLGQIQAAIDYQSGASTDVTFVSFNGN